MKLLDKIITYGLYLFVFLMPWQTRWIYHEGLLNGGVWEYGRFSLYGTEILLVVLLGLSLGQVIRSRYKIFRLVRPADKQNSKLWFFVGLLVIWSALTILWSSDKQLAWYGWLRLAEGVGLVWLITQNVKLTTKNLGLALITAGVVQSLMAVGQWVMQLSLANKWLGLSFLNPSALGTAVVDNGVGRFLRAYGSLPHPNMLAGFLVICLLAAVILIVIESSGRVKRLLLAATAVMSMGLFLTFSRAGWLTLFICLVVYLLAAWLKKSTLKNFWPAVLIIVLVFGFLTYIYGDLVQTRLTSLERLEVKSNQERLAAIDQSQSVIKQHWLGGVGLGQYTLVLAGQQPGLMAWAYQPVHNTGLMAWAELGFVGLLLLILIMAAVFKSRSEFYLLLIAVLVLGLFDHYFISFYFGIMLGWLVIGWASLKA